MHDQFRIKKEKYKHIELQTISKIIAKRQILWESSIFYVYGKGLILALKTEKQFQNKNHTEDLALGSYPCDNRNVTH